MGPQISEKQRERVLGYIEMGVDEGATLALGGGRPEGPDKGWFVEPTLFTDVDNSMTIAQEEIFGPVLAVIPFEDDDDAVRIANESVYGLGGAHLLRIATSARWRVARRVRTGSLSIERRRRLRRRPPLRRLQGERRRTPERHRRLRPVPRDQVAGLAGRLSAHAARSSPPTRSSSATPRPGSSPSTCPSASCAACVTTRPGSTDAYWRQGAELGWTSLLVAEAHGGGSISGDGLVDLTLVADEFGRHAAPGPLVPTNVVAAALSEVDGDRWADVLAGLLAGTSSPPGARPSPPRRRAGHRRARGPRRRRRAWCSTASSARSSPPSRPTTCSSPAAPATGSPRCWCPADAPGVSIDADAHGRPHPPLRAW